MYEPIRIERSSKYGNNYWETYSPKLKRKVKLFSDLEYDHWVLIETDPNVKSFCEQPRKISHLLNGEIVRSIFDMWVQYYDGSEAFYEVKYSKELNENNPKFDRTTQQITVQSLWCKNNGYHYEVRTDKEIRENITLLNNMKQILSLIKLRPHFIETDRKAILNKLETNKETIGSIVRSNLLPSANRVFECISWLIYQGYIDGNLKLKQIDFETEVWINGKY